MAIFLGGGKLSWAAARGDEEQVRKLIEDGSDVHETSFRGSALHEAARRGHDTIAELLIDARASVNHADVTGDTPLHCAVSHGRVGIAKILIARGANVNAREIAGGTPLNIATTSIFITSTAVRKELVEVLMNAGADLSIRDNFLIGPADNQHVRVVKRSMDDVVEDGRRREEFDVYLKCRFGQHELDTQQQQQQQQQQRLSEATSGSAGGDEGVREGKGKEETGGDAMEGERGGGGGWLGRGLGVVGSWLGYLELTGGSAKGRANVGKVGGAGALERWEADILPNWEERKGDADVESLFRRGLPPDVRGRAWMLSVGNARGVSHDTYVERLSLANMLVETGATATGPDPRVPRTRGGRGGGGAAGPIKRVSGGGGGGRRRGDAVSGSKSISDFTLEDGDDDVAAANRRDEAPWIDQQTLRQINLDLDRTFPELLVFNAGGMYHESLRNLLYAVACHTPTVGYLQGMGFIAAVFLLYLPPADAFVCLINVLANHHFTDFLTVDIARIDRYAAAFGTLMMQHLPLLYKHLSITGIDPRLFLVEWWVAVFGTVLPVDCLSVTWDLLLFEGVASMVKVTLGILHVLSDELIGATTDRCLFVLTHAEDFLQQQCDEDISSERTCKSFSRVLSFANSLSITSDEFMDLVNAPEAEGSGSASTYKSLIAQLARMSQDDEAAASIRRERMRQGLANMWSKASSWADAQGGGDGGGEGGGEGGGGLRAAAGRWGEAVAIAAEAFHERALFPLLPLGGKGKHADGDAGYEGGDAEDDFEIVDKAKEGAAKKIGDLGIKSAGKPVPASSLPPARAGPEGLGDDGGLPVIEEALSPTPTGHEADLEAEDEVFGDTGEEDGESNQIKLDDGAD